MCASVLVYLDAEKARKASPSSVYCTVNGIGYRSSVHDFIADVATRCTNRKTVPNDPLKLLQHLSKTSLNILLVVDEIDAILSKGSRQNHTSTTKKHQWNKQCYKYRKFIERM